MFLCVSCSHWGKLWTLPRIQFMCSLCKDGFIKCFCSTLLSSIIAWLLCCLPRSMLGECWISSESASSCWVEQQAGGYMCVCVWEGICNDYTFPSPSQETKLRIKLANKRVWFMASLWFGLMALAGERLSVFLAMFYMIAGEWSLFLSSQSSASQGERQ